MKSLTRRHFLATTSAATATWIGGTKLSAGQPVSRNKPCRMKLGFLTSLAQDKTIPELIDLAMTYGYEAIEFRPEWKQAHGVELSMSKAKRQETRARFVDQGIAISAVSPGVKFLNDDRDQQLEKLYRYINLAADLGACCVRFFADPLPVDPVQRRESHKVQAEYQARAAQRAWDVGVLLALETHGNSIGVDAGEMMFLAGFPPAFRVNWHLSHSLKRGEDADTAYRHIKGRVVHVHFSFPDDTKAMKPLQRQFELLLHDGYTGTYSLEVIRKGDNRDLLRAQAEKWKQMKAAFHV